MSDSLLDSTLISANPEEAVECLLVGDWVNLICFQKKRYDSNLFLVTLSSRTQGECERMGLKSVRFSEFVGPYSWRGLQQALHEEMTGWIEPTVLDGWANFLIAETYEAFLLQAGVRGLLSKKKVSGLCFYFSRRQSNASQIDCALKKICRAHKLPYATSVEL